MRKHALTQSASSIEATLYALNAYRVRQNGTISDNERISRIKQTTVKDAFEYLSMATKDLLVKLDHIADVEYTFKSLNGLIQRSSSKAISKSMKMVG